MADGGTTNPARNGGILLRVSGYGAAVLLVAAATVVCLLVRPFLAPTNMVMFYLLAVVLAALRLGLRPAVLTATLSVVAFDFFLVPPRFTLAVADTEYIVTFIALFTVGVVISTLVTQARERGEALREREVQAQVLQAREALERSLLNSISHDLRSPLTTVTGVLSALREEGERIPPQARGELVETAWEEAARLNRFVGNLLDMTRLEAGALRLKEEECDAEDLVGSALAALGSRADGRGITVRIAPGLPPVKMDMVLMIQVLVNLLDNALKYAPAEAPVEIAASMQGESLLLEVADRGPGIPEEELSRVFDKFYRVPVPEGAGGTGLGLSICKGIVEAHGGAIRAENRSGGGLRVLVTLPASPQDR